MNGMGALFFASLLGYALLLMVLVPRIKAGSALFCAMCGMLFAAFYGGIVLGLLVPVAYGLIGAGLACVPVGLAAAVLNKRGVRSRLLSPGMLFYLAAAVLVIIKAWGGSIQDHDSLSFWMRAPKELYTFDRFYIHADSNMFHMDYIPLLASLQYCVVRVFGWQDAYVAYVVAACTITAVSLLADLLPRRWAGFVGAAAMMYAFRATGYEILETRADAHMMMVFTAGLVGFLAREDDSAVSIAPALCACAVLTGFKIYVGLMFAAVIIIALFAAWVRLRRRATKALRVMAVLALVLTLLMQFGWSALYHYSMEVAAAEAEVARAAYLGTTITAQADISVGALLSGNPRTAQLLQSFTPENIEKFLLLAEDTFAAYAGSLLPWAWLFVLGAVVLAVFAPREKRAAAIRMLVLLLVTGVIFLFGLFASYFVQSETAPAAVRYLTAVTTPLMIASIFLCLWMMDGRLYWPGLALAAAMTAGCMLMLSPAELVKWEEPNTEYDSFNGLAYYFYNDELEGFITPEDAGKRALLIENSWEAGEVRSRSGKTHAYQYYALPLRVMEPIYYSYGDYTQLEDFDVQPILDAIAYYRCDLLILRMEDSLYWDALYEQLGFSEDEWTEPIGVYDITRTEEGTFAFHLRE